MWRGARFTYISTRTLTSSAGDRFSRRIRSFRAGQAVPGHCPVGVGARGLATGARRARRASPVVRVAAAGVRCWGARNRSRALGADSRFLSQPGLRLANRQSSRGAARQCAVRVSVGDVILEYHLLHHGHLNEVDFDTDVPGPTESQVVGGSSVRKTLWLAAFGLVVGTIRPRLLRRFHYSTPGPWSTSSFRASSSPRW